VLLTKAPVAEIGGVFLTMTNEANFRKEVIAVVWEDFEAPLTNADITDRFLTAIQ